MNIDKLVMHGKIVRTVTFTAGDEDYVFHLTTPEAEGAQAMANKPDDTMSVIVAFVTKVERPKAKEVVEINTPENVQWLRQSLGHVQGVIVRKLADACTEMMKEQEALAENFTKVS